MRPLAPLAALLLVACGSPTSDGNAPDAATSDRPAGWAPSGTEVLGPAECQPGLLACQRGASPGRPAPSDAQWFCIRRDASGHCGACGNACPSGACDASDASAPTCAP